MKSKLKDSRQKVQSLKDLTCATLLLWAKNELKDLGSSEACRSAEWLLIEATGIERSALYLDGKRKVSVRIAEKFVCWVLRRKKREPVAYIIKKAAFWEEVLKVNRHTLIPRPETEILVERFIDKAGFEKNKTFEFIDIGCGSGAIGIALLRMFPKAKATLVDISGETLKVAEHNIKKYELKSRSKLVKSNLFRNILKSRKFDALVSNPPYFRDKDWGMVEPEIFFEPKRALKAGRDGLDFYRKIADESCDYLSKGAPLFLEVGYEQAGQVKQLFTQTRRYKKIRIYKDLSGIERVVQAQRL